MDKMKIQFDIIITDDFHYSEDNGYDNTHLWPKASSDGRQLSVDLVFTHSEGADTMTEAESALDDWVKENYPNKTYKIYYWWWKK